MILDKLKVPEMRAGSSMFRCNIDAGKSGGSTKAHQTSCSTSQLGMHHCTNDEVGEVVAAAKTDICNGTSQAHTLSSCPARRRVWSRGVLSVRLHCRTLGLPKVRVPLHCMG